MRPFGWFIIAVQILFVIWILATASAASETCDNEFGRLVESCQDFSNARAGVAMGAIIFFWAAVDVILGIIWMVTNSSRRDCPACGSRSKRGLTVCSACGHDFAGAARTASVQY
jgi:hypothetical protein